MSEQQQVQIDSSSTPAENQQDDKPALDDIEQQQLSPLELVRFKHKARTAALKQAHALLYRQHKLRQAIGKPLKQTYRMPDPSTNVPTIRESTVHVNPPAQKEQQQIEQKPQIKQVHNQQVFKKMGMKMQQNRFSRFNM